MVLNNLIKTTDIVLQVLEEASRVRFPQYITYFHSTFPQLEASTAQFKGIMFAFMPVGGVFFSKNSGNNFFNICP